MTKDIILKYFSFSRGSFDYMQTLIEKEVEQIKREEQMKKELAFRRERQFVKYYFKDYNIKTFYDWKRASKNIKKRLRFIFGFVAGTDNDAYTFLVDNNRRSVCPPPTKKK
jgi:hypothetical protein